jgi:hypothetical protein
LIRIQGDLWAITSYFNPMGYRRRLANYRLFRGHLGIPLITVELAYGPEFELQKEDAEILVRLRGRDILWQKERLLNLALLRLPPHCKKVVWVDCDVVFTANDWAERTSALLDRFLLVQPFKDVHHVRRNWKAGEPWQPACELRHSVPFLVASGVPAATCLGCRSFEQFKPAPGFAWAAPRELLHDLRFYDACIVGGGDGVITRAAYGCFAEAIEYQMMNEQFEQHYLSWANRFHDAVRDRIAFANGDLLHLWHGRAEDRRYAGRMEGILNFDPSEDLALDENGVWQWNSSKRQMHEYVRRYFISRREDA